MPGSGIAVPLLQQADGLAFTARFQPDSSMCNCQQLMLCRRAFSRTDRRLSHHSTTRITQCCRSVLRPPLRDQLPDVFVEYVGVQPREAEPVCDAKGLLQDSPCFRLSAI